MKRLHSMILALAVALGCLALTGALGRTEPLLSEAADGPEAPALPAMAVTPGPGASARPTAAATPTPEPTPEVQSEPTAPASAKALPEATPPALPEPDVAAPSPTPEPAGAGMVAGADYDFSQTVPQTEAVDSAYFDDAVFIGDSRTDGFRMFSGLNRGDYLVKTGLSVFQVESQQVLLNGGKKTTVFQALDRGEYGKVYICLGLNELGMEDDQGYYDHYAALIDRIRALQPQATVYIQLLIPVNAQKCGESNVADYVNNDQIAVYNGLLRQLAGEKQVFLLDPAQDIVDQTGQPPYDAVGDGVHFKEGPYRQWLGYLKHHTVDKGEWI